LQTRFVVVSELQYYEFAPPFQPLISKRQQTLDWINSYADLGRPGRCCCASTQLIISVARHNG
jgi:hypothetical protein